MTIYDPRVEGKAHHICHMIGEETGKPASDKLRSDVFLTTRAVAAYWKDPRDIELAKKAEYKLHELLEGIRRLKPNTNEEINMIISLVMEGESIRNIIPFDSPYREEKIG